MEKLNLKKYEVKAESQKSLKRQIILIYLEKKLHIFLNTKKFLKGRQDSSSKHNQIYCKFQLGQTTTKEMLESLFI